MTPLLLLPAFIFLSPASVHQVAAVKLGTVSPRVWESLERQGIDSEVMDEAAAEAAASAAATAAAEATKGAAAKEGEELKRLKVERARREALDRAKDIDWKSTADAAKKERELDEKYGMWKHVILNPWFQWVMGLLDDLAAIELVGEARMAPAAILVLLYMLFKARQPLSVLCLAAAFFYNIHPILIAGSAVGLKAWSKLRRPKGYVPVEEQKKRLPGAVGEAQGVEGDPRSAEAKRGKAHGAPGLSEDARDIRTLLTLPKDVDHIVLGSGVGGLYAAALLARVGHRVLVLEGGETVGNCTSELKGVECDWGLLNAGMVHVYDELLKAGALEGAPEVKWSRIGTEADGYSFDVVKIEGLGDVVYRAGKQALVDDQVTSAPGPENRERVGTFVSRLQAVAREQSAFFIGRLFSQQTAGWITTLLGQQYGGVGSRTAEQVLGVTLPEYRQLDLLRGMFRTENLQPSELSFAAYVSATNHALEGLSYPQGGFRSLARALVPTIQAAGGRVLTRAHVREILLDSQSKPTRAVGVVLENGEKVSCAKSVICASGVVPLFTQYLPKAPLPAGGDCLQEARPRLYTLVLLKGSAEELELPASDYYQLPTEEGGGGGGGAPRGWFHIYFPSAKEPSGVAAIAGPVGKDTHGKEQAEGGAPGYSTCVIETEADDDILEVCYRRVDGSTSSKPVSGPADARSKGKAAPGSSTTAAGPSGLKFYHIKPPSDQKVRRLQQGLVRHLLQLYPQLEGHVEEQGIQTVGPFRVGLSHRPPRFMAPGLRTRIVPGVANVLLGGGDLVLGTFVGSLLGGWLAAHSALNYGALDLLVLERNLNNDLKNVPRPRYEGGDGEEPHAGKGGGDGAKQD